jgi:hypothetical protein
MSRNALTFHVVITDAQVFLKISLCIFQTVLRLHRQHDGKLSHHLEKPAPKRAQDEWQMMLSVNRV